MDPIAQALAEIRSTNQAAHDPIAQALAEIRAGSQTTASTPRASMPPEPSVTPSAPVWGLDGSPTAPHSWLMERGGMPGTGARHDPQAPNYWDVGTLGKGLLKGIAELDTRKAERADIETARAFRQSNDPTRRPNLLELGMAALSDPSVLEIQDKGKQARAAAEVEAYNSAVRAEALRRNAEQWDPGEYHVPTEGVGKVLHDLAVNAPYTLKNMPLSAAATLAAGPYGAFTGSLPGGP